MPAPIISRDQSGLQEGLSSGINSAMGAMQQALENRNKQSDFTNMLTGLEGQGGELGAFATALKDSGTSHTMGMPLVKSRMDSAVKNPPATSVDIKSMSTLFKKFGQKEDVADRNAELWFKLTTGGQTEMAKMLVDQISRNQYGNKEPVDPTKLLEVDDNNQPMKSEKKEFQWPKLDIFSDKTPKERSKMKGELLKANNVEYKEISEKVSSYDRELLKYGQLKQLNDGDKLPKGLEKYNINWVTGDLRAPGLANAETQLYAKTIADFTVNAKDSYGARVTNFELGTFMKRLPSLANTEDGRRLILEQATAMKELDKLEIDSLRQVYDKYGTQGIDRGTADKIAREYRKDKEIALKKRVVDSVKAQEIHDARTRTEDGFMPVRKPDGSIGQLPIDKIDKAKAKGWEIL